ncbi:hypothetical protein CUU80_08885 [Bifidobacterium scaligerum]|uniref:Uncharacterized protein n=2 Tax=Bifidobacterium scaligerum TaxID=2052656 RepID=A0A2M9HP19_9BIFI|nr:hypothetical protein CUU80_08885 [Bifidobacterium scaligerum]
MFWLGVLVAELAVLVGLCLFTADYAAVRLSRDRVFLLGCGGMLVLDSAELWHDMKDRHCVSGLMSREQYGRFRKAAQASCRARKIVDFKGFQGVGGKWKRR